MTKDTSTMFDIRIEENALFDTENFIKEVLGKKAINNGEISREEVHEIAIKHSRKAIEKAINQRIFEEFSNSEIEHKTWEQIGWLEETIYPHLKMDYISRIFNQECPVPLRVQINPSERCNQNCTHCINAEFRNNDKRDVAERDMPYEVLINLPKQLADIGVKTYSLSGGGEPLINEASMPSLVKAKELGMRTKLITNGILLSKYKNDISRYVDHLRISLDAADAKTSYEIHKTNYFDEIVKNIGEIIELAKKAERKLKVILSYQIQQANIEGFEKFAELGKKLGIRRIIFETPYDIESVKLSKADLSKIYSRLNKIKKAYEKDVEIYIRGDQFTGKRETSQNFEKCYTLFPKITIAANGNVAPCCRLAHEGGVKYPELMIGKVDEKTSVKDVLTKENIGRVIEKIIPCKCPSCIPSEYDINVVLNDLANSINLKVLRYRATDFFRLPSKLIEDKEKGTAIGGYLHDLFKEYYEKTSELYERIVFKKEMNKEIEKDIAEIKLSELKLRGIYQLKDKIFSGKSGKEIELKKKIKINTELQISDKIFAGKNVLASLPSMMKESCIIAENEPFKNVSEYTNNKLSCSEKCFFVGEKTSGEELNKIINSIKGDKKIKQIIGIGSGRALNYAKFVSMKTDKPIITVPTALTTHVYASPKLHADKAIKDLGIDRRIDWKIPDLALIDVDFLEQMQKKDKKLINTGLGDIMAFVSAVEDWKMAYEKGTSEINYAVVDLTEKIIKDIGELNSNQPLNKWIKEYAKMQTALCYITDLVGPAPAAGSEHLFSNAVEKILENSEKQPLHGEVVALGTLIMSYLQNKDYKNVQKMMAKHNLPISLNEMGMTKEQAVECLYKSKEEGLKKGRYTVLDSLDMNEEFCKKTIDYLLKSNAIKE